MFGENKKSSTAVAMNDLYKSCRLCFVATGVKEVTSSPELLKAIRDLYDVEVGSIMQINWKNYSIYAISSCGATD